MKIGILASVLAFGLTACGGPQMKTPKQAKMPKQTKQCKIQYYEFATGYSGETEYMPKKAAVKQIKSIKVLPGFSKPQTDQWLSCK